MTDVGAGRLGSMVEYARRRPAAVLAWILGLHLVVWTLLPTLLSPNLQLDLVEGLALGREWQLGYWKHPPLPWWLADLAYRVTGHLDAVYVLGPLAAVICYYAVWLLARDTVGEFKALIAVVALEGVHYYTISVVKFAHDQMLLPVWALTGVFFWRAVVRGRAFDWMLAGLFLAGTFWSKYSVLTLAVTLGLVLLLDPFARRSWRTPGPYVMAAVFAIVVAPNVWWLVNNDFLPLQYVSERSAAVMRWYDVVLSPLGWIGSQVFFLAPALAMLALLYLPRSPNRQPAPADDAFNRRYIAAIALGPFILTTVIATILGRQPVAFWGYPMWSFLPLAVLIWAPPVLDLVRLRRFAGAAIAVLIAFPLAFAIDEIAMPLLSDRLKATQFPGRLLAETVTRRWREKTGNPLSYVGGAIVYSERRGARREAWGAGQFASNNVAVYSADRPQIIANGELAHSPWIDRADLERRGAVLVWQSSEADMPKNLQRSFPNAELQPPLSIPRRTLLPWVTRSPVTVYYALILPRP